MAASSAVGARDRADPVAHVAPHTRDLRRADNQPPPLLGHDVIGSDHALVEAVLRPRRPRGAGLPSPRWASRRASAEAREHGRLANAHEPALTPYDRYGHRIDEVEFHPSWHWLWAGPSATA